MKPGGGQILDLRALYHPSIADEGHMPAAKSLGDFAHLIPERFKIARVAFKHLDRDRLSGFIAQQPDDDLLFASLLVPVVAPIGQGVVLAFQIAGSDVVKKKFRRPPAPAKLEQPLFYLVKLSRVRFFTAERLAPGSR
jgi:hypothetical protein